MWKRRARGDAHVMREHKVRHLPVLVGGALVGMVTERDLHLVETLRDVDPETPVAWFVSSVETVEG